MTEDALFSKEGEEESPPAQEPQDPESIEAGPEPPFDVEPMQPDMEAAQPQPSRLGKALRKTLRWTVFVLVIFTFGVVTTIFVRVQPQTDEIRELRGDLGKASRTIDDLQAEINDLNKLKPELTKLEAENSDLAEKLVESEQHQQILATLIDVVSAQAALSEDDLITAKTSLADTDDHLQALQENLAADENEIVEGIRARLTLILEELEEDTFAAKKDLEVLANNLTALERMLFGK